MTALKNNKFKNLLFKKKYKAVSFNYDTYWSSREESILRERHIEIPRHIDNGSKVLDLACGDGVLLKHIEMRKNNMELHGIDISPSAIALCNKKSISASIGDISSVDFELRDQFDYIVLSECLEHISNPEDVLDKVRHRYNKKLVITIPNTGYFIHRISLLFGTFPVQWIYHPSEHLRFWTLSDFNTLLDILGFSRRKVFNIKGLPFLGSIWPSLFSQQLLYVIEK